MSLLQRLMVPPPARTAGRSTVAVLLPDGASVEVLWVRDPRARRLRLLVSERGARFTVPVRAAQRDAERFLQANLPWLAQELARRAARPAPPVLMRGDVGPLPLRGVPHALHWRDATLLRIEAAEESIVVHAPPGVRDATIRRALRDFYVAQARRDVGRWLPKYLPGLPRAPRTVRIRPLASLWGSLSPSDAVSLDLALVLGPPAAFEYVLVHELCHLIHANHSRAFWREVEQRCPDWRTLRAWFRGEGLQLKAQLRCLLASEQE